MKLALSARHFLYAFLVLGFLWVLYFSRPILPPFILAAGFAYVLNPLVRFLTQKGRLSRPAAVFAIYLGLIGSLVFVILTVGAQLAEESESFATESRNFLHQAASQIPFLPIWLQPVATDLLTSARSYFVGGPRHVVSFLPGVLNGTVNILVFLVAAFYFLKDGHQFVSGAVSFLPHRWHREAELILQKVNRVLGDYLRAQLLLVIIMSSFTFIGLSIMGVRYALVLSIFTGFAEIVPFVGPVIAAVLAMIVAYTDGVSRLGFDPISEMVVVAVFYTVLRQLEDYFVIPNVLGKMVKLHPLVVLFTVLFGGHLFGVLGVVLAVPLVASLKVIATHIIALQD